MKQIAITLVTIGTLAFASCGSENANRNVQLSNATLNKSHVRAEILYTAYGFQLQRVWINGLPYLVNSKGGIILEASEAEYGALVDATKDGSK